MREYRFCQGCHTSIDTVYSDHFRATLCPDCFNDRCRDEGEPLTLEDIEELDEQMARGLRYGRAS